MAGQSFTIKYNKRVPRLISEIHVMTHDPARLGCKISSKDFGKAYQAIWDTGATGSVISTRLVNELKLSPISVVKVSSANGTYDSGLYYVDMVLPNRVGICKIRVTEGNFPGADVLIGMDVIGSGDFTVTNFLGKTTFTFRTPSLYEVDYVKKSYLDPYHKEKEPGRNDPCHCGSGRKYKDCCLKK